MVNFFYRFFKLILNAKVHAIRDAQVVEKQQIKKEVVDEEKRLDTMMEVDRLNAIRIQEEIEKRRHLEQREYEMTNERGKKFIKFY